MAVSKQEGKRCRVHEEKGPTILAKIMWDTLVECYASIVFHMENNAIWAKFYLLA